MFGAVITRGQDYCQVLQHFRSDFQRQARLDTPVSANTSTAMTSYSNARPCRRPCLQTFKDTGYFVGHCRQPDHPRKAVPAQIQPPLRCFRLIRRLGSRQTKWGTNGIFYPRRPPRQRPLPRCHSQPPHDLGQAQPVGLHHLRVRYRGARNRDAHRIPAVLKMLPAG
jgi:hypothetical protein